MTPGQRAEARITDLGIRDPRDLDVEVIAFDSGVRVEYAPLIGCEAMLVGVGSRAIATVRPRGNRGRERFSVGHELGHWELHRGQSFRCRVDDPDQNLQSDVTLERQADEFASHLLMPTALFNPGAMAFRYPSVDQIDDLANTFQTSRVATTIRMAKVDSLPVIVACYSTTRLLWFVPAPHVPRRWFLKARLDADTFAHDLLTRGAECRTPRKQSADAWFENNDAGEFEVLEQCFDIEPGRVLATLYLCDAEMFDRGYDPDVRWRNR
jgi:IrrE N-terminal-like domain